MAFKFFGFGNSTPLETTRDTVRALPGEWYTSEDMYQLERRAIFSKRWLLVTHKNRLREQGQWLQYEIAGYNIVLVRDRTDTINCFHNVCRHRAYSVVEGEQGKSFVFSCRYHGWSYGLNGKLAKAPGYQDMPNFDKSQNGLFPVHVHIDAVGFIWVNLDSAKTPSVAWEDDFLGGDTQTRYSQFDFDDYDYDHSWQIDADYNWKLAADNYNECYHCKTTHPDIPDVVDLSSYSVDVQRAWFHHNGSTEREVTDEQKEKGLLVCSSYYWPNISVNVSKNFIFTQRFLPKGPQKTLILYEVYRNKHASDEDFELIDSMYKRVMTEDKALCNAAQKNINAGIFINGELHPTLEKGPLYFQKLVREAVVEHFKREQDEKREIWPAKMGLPEDAAVSKQDMEFCSEVNCCRRQEVQV
ncbi:Carnitine monooxygenase oxygenase subunit [Colletotrichum siamense]|nr:Carnitine monooxygenase oxygenase subunit [Colletotrichum siamense]KAI8170998.1 hypothetical protein KHU50_005797 [Colletotrichum sp. SAR 10_65]KAI8178503.1 hypothetical protein K4K51_004505 [Colletotrichum sp. SAR 10_75]KAI8205962.1 hypothetical protein K4K52_003573 [Colletotrichum sp. SAR 10_76]KAI8229163.1 hypothetical protein K4K53_005625 [Colletotrichum sp. SAR 10_77]